MIIDNSLLLADAQSSTVDAASTSYIDTLAAGNAYVGAWFVCRVDTAPTVTYGAPTMTFQLQTADSTDFYSTNPATLAASSALVSTSLATGSIVYAVRIPAGAKRYLRGYLKTNQTGTTIAFAGGAYDMFITNDLDMLVDHNQ